jgi:hypothetical protein
MGDPRGARGGGRATPNADAQPGGGTRAFPPNRELRGRAYNSLLITLMEAMGLAPVDYQAQDQLGFGNYSDRAGGPHPRNENSVRVESRGDCWPCCHSPIGLAP